VIDLGEGIIKGVGEAVANIQLHGNYYNIFRPAFSLEVAIRVHSSYPANEM
jgi:hypothetical protein